MISCQADRVAVWGGLSAGQTTATRDRNDVIVYTNNVLRFWCRNGGDFPEIAKAARIAFSISVSSAASERVFSLMKRFFGKHSGRDSALADSMRASLMLSYNRRVTP